MEEIKILVAEDESIVAEDIRRKLTNFGYAVPAVVCSGAEAVRAAEAFVPDLVLMDIVLQGEPGGVETAEELQSRFDIPVIFLTAHADSKTVGKAKSAGPYGYIIKPFDDRILQITIDMALYKHSTEKKLRESEERFRTLLEAIPDMVFFKDLDGRHLVVNKAVEEFTGVGREELLGKTDEEMLPPEAASACMKSDREVMKSMRQLRLDEQVKGRNGENIFLDTIKAPFFDGSGIITGVVGVSRDITERKKAEDRLKLFSKAIQETMDGVHIVDLDGRIIYSNKAAEEIYGFSSEEVLGKHVEELNVEKEIDRNVIIPEVNKTGRWSGELMVYHKSGRKFPIWLSASMVTDEAENPLAIIGIMRDITERRQTERELKNHRERLMESVEERTLELKSAVKLLTNEITVRKNTEAVLKESEGRFRSLSQEFNTLLDAIPDILLLLSPDLKIKWANRAAEKEFSKKGPELEGRHCYELWHDRGKPCEDCHVIKSFGTGEAMVDQRTSPLGRVLDSRSFPIKEGSGQVQNVILVVSDITEKITMQAEAMRAGHLASLGELAAGIAHEINNPVNGIINYAQMISNKADEGTREGEIAGRIIKEGDRISGIVRSLLSFARERREEKLPSDVKKIVQETIDLTGAQARKEGIRIILKLEEGLPGIIANPQQIQQVFLNLISNSRYALKKRFPAGDANKKIDISTAKVVVEGRPYVRIIFHDQGCGIPADVLDKVINPFFSTKPGGEGTGLGLSISHGLVKDHGGRLLVESLEGSFTTVTVDLPAMETNEQ